MTEALGRPIAISSTPANGDERKEVEKLLHERKAELRNPSLHKRAMIVLEADRGYDAQWLRQKLLAQNILPFIPWRKKRNSVIEKPSSAAVMEFFNFKSSRWQVERAFSWVKRKCRRIMNRWERKQLAWLAFTKAALIDYWIEILMG